jgi:hypothetical protein
MMKKTISFPDLIASGGDAGEVYEGFCPKCGDKVRVATNGWNETVCSCGLNWTITLELIGEK